MGRPKLTERITLRLPDELLSAIHRDAARRQCSVNEVAVCAIENELARLLTYRLDFYGELLPLETKRQGDIVRQLSSLSDTNVVSP